mmetsp:Transcript_35850/g.57139  ORF Transcript_35850/g.57139 Transcript_35850/m.57139 type:complete len:214 (-) Transcript_35850:1085-1726(-)
MKAKPILDGFQDTRLEWLHGCPLEYLVNDAGNVLTFSPSACKDMWRRTYYEPPINKYDMEVLVASVEGDSQVTLTAKFDLTAASQFDQACLVVCVDEDHWLKAGIEFVDGEPRLSCVVTNNHSDWSSEPFVGDKTMCCSAYLRIHKKINSYIVEVFDSTKNDWRFIRIAHLEHWGYKKVNMGVGACCPTAQEGCSVSFSDFSLTHGTSFNHHA